MSLFAIAMCNVGFCLLILGVGAWAFFHFNTRRLFEQDAADPDTGEWVRRTRWERGTRATRLATYSTIAAALVGYQLGCIIPRLNGVNSGCVRHLIEVEYAPFGAAFGGCIGLFVGRFRGAFLTEDTRPHDPDGV